MAPRRARPLSEPHSETATIDAVQEKLSLLNANHPQIDSIDEAAEFLSTILTGLFSKAGRPVEEPVVSLESCKARLVASPRLYRDIRAARLSGELGLEEYHFIPPLISASCHAHLDELRPMMHKIANANTVFDPWDPRTQTPFEDEKLLEFLQSLGLPAEDDRLSIIAFELGDFQKDPILRERVGTIFNGHNKFLVNASGTGKTRLCYEGLCQNWGFYLTCKVDSGRLASSDAEELLARFVSHARQHVRSGEVHKNIQLVIDYFGAILLSRLINLLLFLEMLEAEVSERHKRHWLEMQLLPYYISQGYREPLEALTTLLLKTDTAHIAQGIRSALAKVRHILGDDEPLFIVLDEASICVDLYPDAFPDESVLQAIIRVFTDLTDGSCTIICSGIGIPQNRFQSGIGSDFEWTSITGGFDDPARQEQYVRKFLPPTLRDSESGRFLMARIWRWLRGRHRATATFMEVLLREGMEHPHSRLDDFNEQVVSFRSADAVDYVAAEGRNEDWEAGFTAYNFRPLSEEEKDIFLERIFRYMATHEPSALLKLDQMQLMYDGPARLVDADLSQLALDEPHPLLGVAQQLFPYPERRERGEPHEKPATFLRSLRRNSPRTDESLAHCLVFYLSQALGKGRQLDEIFSFPHRPPVWARQGAELVRFHRDSGEVLWTNVARDDFESFRPLATQVGSVEAVVTWMEHEAGTAFCILPPTANADLLFVIKLADESFVWVALKALATDQPLHASDLKDQFAVLQANSFLGNIDDTIQSRLDAALDSLPKTGRCKLLRAVSSFPVEITVLDESVNSKVKDVAVVSIAALESKAYQVKQTDFFDAIVAGVLAGHKRKSPWEPKDGKLYTSSKRLKRDSDWERPRASWDGPVEGVDDDDTDEETTTSSSPSPPPPPPKRKPRPQAKSNPPVQATEGKGKGKGMSVPVASPATRKRKRLSDPKPAASAVASSSKRPRPTAQTPRKQHEETQKRGWRGWVEGSPPPPANLIDLDSVPILPGRRTRSGKNFDALSGKEG